MDGRQHIIYRVAYTAMIPHILPNSILCATISQKMGSWPSLSLVLLLLCLCSNHCPVCCLQNETDRMALISFRESVHQDPRNIFSSWNDSVHHCAWYGVVCGRRHPERVVGLKLDSQGLGGSLSPHIGNLSFLRNLSLHNNSFHGQIPQEIGRLFRLRLLSLGKNLYVGCIPPSLSQCSNLETLVLLENKLVGSIPPELGSLTKLKELFLARNRLTGTIPDSLGNLSSLYLFHLSQNGLQGQIPESFLQLRNLRYLAMKNNNLTGKIPYGIFNISGIEMLHLDDNQFNGSIPSDIGLTLPNLKSLRLLGNRFTGRIPPTLSNASTFEQIHLAANYFTGTIPKNLGSLPRLQVLVLSKNQLQDDLGFMDSLTNCSRLYGLSVSANLLSGTIPYSIANLSTNLQFLSLSGNRLYGTIPSWIENLTGLRFLLLHTNYLSGPIHVNFTSFQRLEALIFSKNNLTGTIPSSLGSLSQLSALTLSNNNLHGSIPPRLGECRSLIGLDLSNNILDGEIPQELFHLTSLSIVLNLSSNRLKGSLLPEVGLLGNLGILDVSNNKLAGMVPNSIAKCSSIEQLHLGGNRFEGQIPQALAALKGLQVLDISRNNLSGKIPDSLSMLRALQYLNVSFNRLRGKVPNRGVFLNASAISVSGNSALCGGVAELKLPSCPSLNPEKKKKKNNLHSLLRILIPLIVAAALLSMAFSFVCYRRKMSKKKGISSPSFNNKILRISYAELFKATDGFSMTNIIGNGSYGFVYKGILDHVGTLLAVKVLNLHQRGASRSFMSECEALGSIRHRNLLKLISACSSVDFQGNDFKALIYEFMTNGSLEKWLHGKEEEAAAEGQQQEESERCLPLIQRLDIALHIASAIEYLHNGCPSTVIHGDLKPSNVLLDDEMVAHVGDFGLARVVSAISGEGNKRQSSSLAIKGSIGYVPPEYGMGGTVSVEGDVYSYGIILLEMFTGKRPTNHYFKDGLNLHTFVEKALPYQVMEVTDQNIPYEGRRDKFEECLLSVMRVGVMCSMEVPEERMKMTDVLKALVKIKHIYGRKGSRQEQRNAHQSDVPSTSGT